MSIYYPYHVCIAVEYFSDCSKQIYIGWRGSWEFVEEEWRVDQIIDILVNVNSFIA